jgi:O-antigen/teichoic acid export membrane protein
MSQAVQTIGSETSAQIAPDKARTRSLASASAVYLISNLLNAAIPFALLPVLTRYLNPAEYGQVAMFQTVLGALGAFVGLGAAGAAGRKYFDEHLAQGDLRDFIASCMQILIASSLLCLLPAAYFHQVIGDWLGLEPTWIVWAIFVAACSVVLQIRLGQWQARQEPHKYAVLQIAQSGMNMLFSLLFVVLLLRGASGRISAQIWAAAAAALVSLAMLKRDRLLALVVWRPEYLREALAFGVPLIPHIAAAFVLNSIDRVVINKELGLSQTGIYMVAVQLAAGLSLVFDAMNRAYTPWLFDQLKDTGADRKKAIVRTTYVWFAIILTGAVVIAVSGPTLVRWIAGARYAAAGEVIGWLVLGQAFMGMYLLLTGYVLYSKRTGLLSAATVVSATINVALLLFLIRVLGMHGAAVAYCVAMGVRLVLTWCAAQRRHPMPWFSFWV